VLTHGGGTPANAPISPGVTLRPPVPFKRKVTTGAGVAQWPS